MDILFINEISMLRIDMFNNIMIQIELINDLRSYVGKRPIQIISSGDFGQLSPIITEEARNKYKQLISDNINRRQNFEKINDRINKRT